MASVIVVDTELEDSIREYGQIIDSINNTTDFSTALKSFLPEASWTQQQLSNDAKAGLSKEILTVSTSETLKKLTDKEFEPTFYLLIHILSQLSSHDEILNNVKSPIYTILFEVNPKQPPSLRDRRSIKSTSVLSILSTIFNLLPKESKTRVYVLENVLKVIKTSGIDFSLIQDNIGTNLLQWLQETKTNQDEIKAIFWDFIELDGEYSQKSLEYIKSFTSSNTLSKDELLKLVKFALSSKIVDVSFLVNNNVAQALSANSSEPLVTLFQKYVHGEIIPAEQIPSDLPADFINSKSKILALAKFFADSTAAGSDHDAIVFKYSEIPNVASSLEFEEILIEAIKAGVIEGKLNQLDETFYLTRVNRFIIAGEDNSKNWTQVKLALEQWQSSLTDINDIVKTARENIVNNNTN
jgi:translation initiation factor 3 subunit M